MSIQPNERHRARPDIRRRLLQISLEEAMFRKRGFLPTIARGELEAVGLSFIHGYHAALDTSDHAILVERIKDVRHDHQGFAFEGAGMALSLLDALSPVRRDRWRTFVSGPGTRHTYMLHVGVGWAMARLPWRSAAPPGPPANPLLRWLCVDGYGFHQGYFHTAQFVGRGKESPPTKTAYSLRAFDQGLGRAIWFSQGADVPSVIKVVGSFPLARRPDLWSGIGLAATYAGGTDQAGLRAIRDAAGTFAPHVAQGAAFAAQARLRADLVTAHTESATIALCGLTAIQAADVTEQALVGIQQGVGETDYEAWRANIRHLLAVSGSRDGI